MTGTTMNLIVEFVTSSPKIFLSSLIACLWISDRVVTRRSGMRPDNGDDMARRRHNLTGGDGPTLKDIRHPVIVLECAPCNRRDSFERKVLVEQFGAAASFAKLRRRFAMGCERMCHPDGDLCGTRFPCLEHHP
jgi:hypothetical protein